MVGDIAKPTYAVMESWQFAICDGHLIKSLLMVQAYTFTLFLEVSGVPDSRILIGFSSLLAGIFEVLARSLYLETQPGPPESAKPKAQHKTTNLSHPKKQNLKIKNHRTPR